MEVQTNPARTMSRSRSLRPPGNADPEVSLKRLPLPDEILRQIGQTLMVTLHGSKAFEHAKHMIEKYHVGSIFISRRDIRDVRGLSRLIHDLQVVAHNAGHRSPLLIATNQENGMVFCDARPSVCPIGPGISRPCGEKISTQLPGFMALGAARSPGLAFEIAKAAGDELHAIGINWNFAPVFDIIDKSNYATVGTRAFGDEASDVGRLGVAFMDGMRAAGIGTLVKNFPGYDSSRRSHQKGPSLYTNKSRDDMEMSDMIPFRRGLAAGLDCISLNKAIWQGNEMGITPDTEHLVHNVVRKRLGFEGPVLCDCNEIDSMLEATPVAEVPLNAALAGCDLLQLRHEPELQILYIEAIYNAVYLRKLHESDVARSYNRVLTMKDRYLTWEKTLDTEKGVKCLPEIVAKHQDLSRNAYQTTLTVVRDHFQLLPLGDTLKPEDSVLLLTPVVQPILENLSTDGSMTDPFEVLGRAIAAKHPKVRHAPYTNLGLTETHLALLQTSRLAIFVTFNATQVDSEVQMIIARTLMRLLEGKALVAIAVGDPYDLLHDTTAYGTYICSYEYTKPALVATAGALFGEYTPTAVLPLKLTTVREQKKWTIERWDKRRDLYSSFDLWQECLGERWPLDQSTFSALLDRPGTSQHFTVKEPGTFKILGLCLTYTVPSGRNLIGSLAILLVKPSHRNLGIGLSLHEAAVQALSQTKGVTQIHLGSIFPRFFPGLPTEIPIGDQNWFMHRGWRMEDNYIYDLYMDMEDWQLDTTIFGQLSQQGVTFGSCSVENYPALLEFEDAIFGQYPGWANKYHALEKTNGNEHNLPMYRYSDIVDAILAFNEGQIVGAALIFSAVGNNSLSQDIPWPKVIGERTGGLACIGMGPTHRGKGVGLGLVQAALMELKNRGFRGCFVDWSTDTALYEGLGFGTWGTYRSTMYRRTD